MFKCAWDSSIQMSTTEMEVPSNTENKFKSDFAQMQKVGTYFAYRVWFQFFLVRRVHRLVCRFQEIFLTVDDGQNQYHQPLSPPQNHLKIFLGVDVVPLERIPHYLSIYYIYVRVCICLHCFSTIELLGMSTQLCVAQDLRWSKESTHGTSERSREPQLGFRRSWRPRPGEWCHGREWWRKATCFGRWDRMLVWGCLLHAGYDQLAPVRWTNLQKTMNATWFAMLQF